MVIIGGGEDKEGDCEILREVSLHLKGRPLIVATVASQAPEEYFKVYASTFKRLGVKHTSELYVHDRSEALHPELAEVFSKSAGIFFTGGDQLRIASQIGDTPIEREVKRLWERGGIVAGTSAGASVMSETMLVKGSNAESHRIGDLHMAPGLGLLPGVIIDQHFAQRGRIGRLLGAVAQNPRVLGIGIDEDTAIVVQNDAFSVIGAGAVYIVDGSKVTRSNIAEGEPDKALLMCDVTLHVLSKGARFDLANRRPQIL